MPENWPNALERLCNVSGQLIFSSAGEVGLVPNSCLFEDSRFSTHSEDRLGGEVTPPLDSNTDTGVRVKLHASNLQLSLTKQQIF